ncbi:CocE/NonD family hydrolase [Pseudahrensia aquimaris]|uniref:CocE/NonD family hydrolase n=1 Tax=Pseudahrensia aquimaris TaxID=744461 RepID=A0ABW3FCF3_9HYPH
MKVVSEFPRKVVEFPDMGIIMPDGCRLSARVWMPEDARDDPVPVILEHLPYRKRDGTVVRDCISHPWMAGHGYAIIRTDMRGSGDSQGFLEDEYTQQEWDDACGVLEWAAAQEWSTGKAGMWGISWGGFNSLQIAALQPPSLKAVISICSTVDRFADDIHTKGGCQLIENFGWASQMLSYSSAPPDPALVGDGWVDAWLERLEHQPWLWSIWARHQRRDDYWKHGSVCEDYSAIKTPVLAVGGWHDGYRNTMAHLAENISAPVKAIAGPWIHKYPHIAAPQPAIGFLQEAKRWWDQWLKDIDTGVEADPAYRAWLMDSLPPQRWWDERPGRWIAEAHWPSSNIQMRRLHLNGDVLAQEGGKVERVVSSPLDCGMASGEYFPFTFSDEFPDEQSEDDARSVCFDGALLEEDMDIVGALIVRLLVSCSAKSGQLAVRLCDLLPDGTSAFITLGVLNLTHRDSHEYPQALVPDEAIEVEITLDQIAYRVPEGHRLRLAISNAYFPFIWPSPEKGSITIHSGSIDLPVRPHSHSDEWVFEPPEGALPWRHEVLREANYRRSVERDPNSGRVAMIIECDNGENRDSDHGLISGSWTRERFSVHPENPDSASAEIEWEATGGREGAMWRTRTFSSMTCDAVQFRTNARIEAWLNGETVFEKDISDTVERDMV